MRILITGASGFIGSKLVEQLTILGHEDIVALTRDVDMFYKTCPYPVRAFRWDPGTGFFQVEALDGVDVVINLSGEPIAGGRWSDDKKRAILESRLKSTQLLISEIKEMERPPKKFISASAIGHYGDRGDEILNEDSTAGSGFLAQVCDEWEKIVLNSDIDGMKCAIVRIGIVLGETGGALKEMLTPFKMGVGGKLGSGNQFMSWIHLEDLVRLFIYLCENENAQGVFNGVAPNPVRNKEFTHKLGNILKKPTIFPVPTFVLKMAFGEMSELLLASQRVYPEQVLSTSFNYKYDKLESALMDILHHMRKGEKVLEEYQFIPKETRSVFHFFKDEKNLEILTPDYLKFTVQGKDTVEIEEGTTIDYKLKIHGLPVKWQSKIVKFKKDDLFIDVQIKGPYKKWEHEHKFYQLTKGTLVKDKVVYKVPFGFLGKIFIGPFVNKDVSNIFEYRKKRLKEVFI